MKKTLLLAITMLLLMDFGQAQNIIYVRYNAVGAKDGTSWSDAFNDLNIACNSSVSGDKIYISAGTYKPSGSTIAINDGVTLMGGFPGGGTPTLQDRDWKTHQTIISGDMLDNDDGTFATRNDNTARIFTSNNYIGLDGLIIQNGGNNTGGTGCALAMGGNGVKEARIINCLFRDHISSNNSNPNGQGGAIRAVANAATDTLYLENVDFERNSAYEGGAVMFQGVCIAKNCKFIDNIASRGSAIAQFRKDSIGSNSYFTNVLFYSNESDGFSSGTIFRYNEPPGNINFTNCTFKDNVSIQNGINRGNIMRNSGDGENNFYNCLFERSVTKDYPFAGIYKGTFRFQHCIGNYPLDDFLKDLDGLNVTLDTSLLVQDSMLSLVYTQMDTSETEFYLDCNSNALNFGDSGLYNNLPLVAQVATEAGGQDRIQHANIEPGAFESNCIPNANDQKIELKSDLIVFPNPATQTLNIQTTLQNEALYLMNGQGQILRHIRSSNQQMDISNIPGGLYILKAESGKSIKFIKQ